jgi:hypothetical protein
VRTRRALFVMVLLAMLLIATAVGNADTNPREPATETVSAAEVRALDAQHIWFCPGLPPGRRVPADQTLVTFSNTSAQPADVVVTLSPDEGKPTTSTFEIAPFTVVTRDRPSLGPAGGLTVETFGGSAVVEEGIDGANGIDISPCATRSGTEWQFAAGTTPRGVQQWLVVLNPYASDAKIDVTIRTNNGVRRPDQLQAFDVPRHTRRVIPIHDAAVREDRVAVEVIARAGRVVAAQTLVFTSDIGTPAIAHAIGSPGASDRWTFAAGSRITGVSTWVAVANVGDDETQVDVQAMPEDNQPVTPASITVPQDDVVWVQLGRCGENVTNCVPIPDGVRYALTVSADRETPIVAQMLERQDGAATSFGPRDPAPTWLFGLHRVSTEQESTLAFFNPFAVEVTVDVTMIHDGVEERPEQLQGVVVAPGRRATVGVAGRKSEGEWAIVVRASGPIGVERDMYGAADASRSVGVRVP